MADGKHTPGPWHVEGSWARNSTGEAGHMISHGLNSQGDGPEGDVCRTISTTIEDARLIAAAPDLLAAAKGQHDAIDILMARLIEVDLTFMPTKSPVWPVLVAGNAAIKKATGGA